jgi:transcriptional regulator with XRE-family HTH domain
MSSGTPGRLDKVLAHATLAGRPSGSVLRLERLSLRIDQKGFAKALGMSRQRLDELEKRERVTDEFIERYRGMLRTVMTIAPDAAASGEG